MDLTKHVWLYIRGATAVHVQRVDLSVIVYGPGPDEHQHLFRQAGTLEQFLVWYHAALVSEDWQLQGYIERRLERTDEDAPPEPGERRRRAARALESSSTDGSH